MNKSKNSAAAALGRLGGLATAARMTANERIGRARAAGRAATLRQSPDERRKHAKLAAKARWANGVSTPGEMKKLFTSGWTQTRIAKRARRSPTRVNQILKRLGVSRSDGGWGLLRRRKT